MPPSNYAPASKQQLFIGKSFLTLQLSLFNKMVSLLGLHSGFPACDCLDSFYIFKVTPVYFKELEKVQWNFPAKMRLMIILKVTKKGLLPFSRRYIFLKNHSSLSWPWILWKYFQFCFAMKISWSRNKAGTVLSCSIE